jgi:hypothetical protein
MLAHVKRELVTRNVGQGEASQGGSRLFDDQRSRLLRIYLKLEPHPGSRGFRRPRVASEDIAPPHWMLHDNGVRRTIFIPECIRLLLPDLAFLSHCSAVDPHPRNSFLFCARAGTGVYCQIDGIGKEALLARANRVEDTFTGECILGFLSQKCN